MGWPLMPSPGRRDNNADGRPFADLGGGGASTGKGVYKDERPQGRVGAGGIGPPSESESDVPEAERLPVLARSPEPALFVPCSTRKCGESTIYYEV